MTTGPMLSDPAPPHDAVAEDAPDVPAPLRAGYDAVLLAGFGGPEGPDDVMPFLRKVTRGRGIPEERLLSGTIRQPLLRSECAENFSC